MYDHDIGIGAVCRDTFESVIDRMLPRLACRRIAADFADTVFCCLLLHEFLPLVANDDHKLVDLGMLLKNIKAIRNDRLVLHHQKLLGAVKTHSAADAACQYDRGIHTIHLLLGSP